MPDALAAQLELLPDYLSSHLLLSMVVMLTGLSISISLGLLAMRIPVLKVPLVTISSIIQTIPGLALLALMVPLLGSIGFLPAMLALMLYSIMPVLRNTITGLDNVDYAITEAARGMGMSTWQVILQVRLPLALPVIIAGIRTALVWTIGMATLSTPVGATSLGNYIFSGLQTQNYTAVLVGCVAAALLALFLDGLVRLIELGVETRRRWLVVASAGVLCIALGAGLAPVVAGLDSGSGPRVIRIGAKPFTEQLILAEVLRLKCEAAGYRTEVLDSLGSTVVFDALEQDNIDCYVEYSGTAWNSFMEREDVLPAGEMLSEVAKWLREEHGIVSLGALGFENTYSLAVSAELAEERNITSIEDLLSVAPELSIGSDYEFFQRPEWRKLQDKYGLEFGRQRTFDPSLMYQAAAAGQVDVVTAYSTDGRIAAFDLRVLTDPRDAFPPYDAMLLVSPVASEDSKLVDSLRELVGTITASEMRQANKLVDVDGKSPAEAARMLVDK
jgi:osmoprotectant transport system permease protein